MQREVEASTVAKGSFLSSRVFLFGFHSLHSQGKKSIFSSRFVVEKNNLKISLPSHPLFIFLSSGSVTGFQLQ
ncbi:hypothetical protein PIB30_037494 [Stylosanthes scabra]|uniref:Uncharacterized protein n=1 Tax=Stylosanthes scabra TaxID=79078 RepID=A0ABU6XBC9_9FABA|nr:hypothetical protein [Stylosanthes scabra]